ncbi:MAG: hypothetical protein F4213_14860 [Boseongicola sp. SB0677_bin_26]|nr:hypothetical protein [Boseongicola sp. SB0677_bin_26]
MTVETFRQELGRVRDRHVADGEFSCHFRHFHRRANDAEELVRRALICEDGTLANIAATVLIIACRFRSDLFRGWKWSYELQGQLENFVHLNKARKRAGELQVEGNSGVLK